MTKHLRSIYLGYVQIAAIDATDATAPYVTKTYRWDPSEPVATRPLALSLWTREGTVRETLYYTHDLRKNVVSLFDANGMRRASYQYDPYGNITSMDGDMAESNPYRFSSEHHDEDLGLVYYNYRHYNPTDGRWTSRDPIAEQGGWNLYGFVNNSPLYFWDSLGQSLSFERRPCMASLSYFYYGYKLNDTDKEGFESEDVYRACGGQLVRLQEKNPGHYINSCALRICATLNASGCKISGNGQRYIKDRKGMVHLLGAEELRLYIERKWGMADILITSPTNKKFSDWSDLIKDKCAIAFYLDPVHNASHIGLIKDGKSYRDKYGRTVGRVALWFVPCKCKKRKKCPRCSV